MIRVFNSVPDPRYFEMDLDQWNRTQNYGSSSGSRSQQKKLDFFLRFFSYYIRGTRTSVVRDNKTVEIKSFLIFLLVDQRIRNQVPNKQLRIRIMEAQKLMDPTDPKHWF
jgi:hypothetical protein